MKKITFSNDQVQDIIALYNNHLPCTGIGKLYGCSKQVINKLLRENKIELRDRYHSQQKYAINEHIFDQIDTPEKAYWLGMLMGDGCVQGTMLCLSLQEKDKEHISRFREFLVSNHKIFMVRNKDKKDGSPSISCCISIYNNHITKSLEKFGIRENKTYYATFPNNVPVKFMSNYMLGLIDSDGCFTVKQNKLYISFISTTEFTDKFQDVLVAECQMNKTKLEIQKSTDFTRVMSYGGNRQLLRVCKYLYCNADMFLPRKKQKAIEWLLSRYPNDEWLVSMRNYTPVSI